MLAISLLSVLFCFFFYFSFFAFFWSMETFFYYSIFLLYSIFSYTFLHGFFFSGCPRDLAGKESTCNAGDTGDAGSIPGLGRSPGRGKLQPTPVFLPEKSHIQRSLAGYSPKGGKESDTTERLSTHTQAR